VLTSAQQQHQQQVNSAASTNHTRRRGDVTVTSEQVLEDRPASGETTVNDRQPL